MSYLPTSEVIILIAALALLIAKTVHYFAAIRRKKVFDFVYFNKESIYNSHSSHSVKAKRTQNILTIALILILAIAAIWQFLAK